MTPQELENIERAYDKAKMQGVQALHDWAYTFAPLLFAEVKHLPPIASDDPANDAPAFNYGDPRRITDALRPFAALGAPVCLTALEEYRILSDLPEALPVFMVPDMSSPGVALAFVTAEQLKAAHDLINEIDGGAGA